MRDRPASRARCRAEPFSLQSGVKPLPPQACSALQVLDSCYRVDLIVEDLVVVEVKAVVEMSAIYQAQTLTYMRLTECPMGLLINFNVVRLIDRVKRLINPRSLAGGRDSGPARPAAHGTEGAPKTQTTDDR